MRLRDYVLATAAGEAVAQIASALVAAASSAYASSVPAEAPYVLPASLVFAGALEGLAVGGAQAYVLRAHVPARPFVLATTLAMTLSWMAGAVVSLVEPASMPSMTLILGVAAVLGLVVGGALGLAQDRVLERVGISGTRFIGYSALGWCVAQLALAMLSNLGDFTLSLEHLALRAVAGLVGGTIAGLVAGPALVDAIETRS